MVSQLTALPNLQQMTRSNLVKVGKKWNYEVVSGSSTGAEKLTVTKLAVARRKDVMKQYCEGTE